MEKRHSLFYYVFIFVLAQLAWLMLLGIWIYWYVTNNVAFEKGNSAASQQIVYDASRVFVFVGGIILLVGISFGLSLIFRNLFVQFKLTNLYDNFIANITHELKSPLSSIQLYLETLDSRFVEDEKRKEFVSLMIKDAERLKNLINSILEISALEQKKAAYNYHLCVMNSIIKKQLNELISQYNLPLDAIKIKGDASCKCVIDQNALKIVFSNLIDNAKKYSVEPVQILIKLYCDNKKAVIEFSDNGIGIPANERKKIFNKFYRIYSNNIPNVKGSGIGLYWVKEIIKDHGGKIFVVNNDKIQGAIFHIEFPVYRNSKQKYLNNLLKITKAKKQLEFDNE